MKILKSFLNRPKRACSQMIKTVVTAGQSPSLRAKEVALKAKLITDCLNPLLRLESDSLRYTLIYGIDAREPSKEEKNYACRIFFQSQGITVQPSTVAGYRKECCRFLEWLSSSEILLVGDTSGSDKVQQGITSFHVASRFSDMSSPGKSVPSRCHAALVWAWSEFL